MLSNSYDHNPNEYKFTLLEKGNELNEDTKVCSVMESSISEAYIINLMGL